MSMQQQHDQLATLAARFREVRQRTEALCEPLNPEDCVIQSMPDVSPTRWHLAHTTWFFETFLLKPYVKDWKSPPLYEHLFNSYYQSIGQPFTRSRRGLLSRPTVGEIHAYRRQVDRAMMRLLADDAVDEHPDLARLVEIGLHHEQQHQELILTDIKHVFSCNPIFPAYQEVVTQVSLPDRRCEAFFAFEEGLREIGKAASEDFAYDNEYPRHRVFLEGFSLQSRLVTNGEYLEFVEDGGYERPELWLSLGWQTVQEQQWQAPLYWMRSDVGWREFTLSGLRALCEEEPVCHVSYFEADAFARWAGARLPTEQEWEVAAEGVPIEGNFVEREVFHPIPCESADTDSTHAPRQLFGDVWEWTASPYCPYPGYAQPEGAIGEYNGKFMCNQYVLRGGSCVSSRSHLRDTYRNFFPPDARWQFSGIRLAYEISPPAR